MAHNTEPCDENMVLEWPQWIAGVGDLIEPSNCTNNLWWSNLGYESSGSPETIFFSHAFASPRSNVLTGSPEARGKSCNARNTLQRHCDFWDSDGDGLIYPWDIYKGFSRLGFHCTLCVWAAVTIPMFASYNTHTSYIPHPLFAINLNNINSNRHGSSTGTFDMDGELDDRRFEAIFQKYAQGEDYLTLRNAFSVWYGQRCGLDFFGWFAGAFECKKFR